MTGATKLGAPALDRLNIACMIVKEAFGDYGCYLVGSALRYNDADNAPYRDVDVRLIMRDDRFEQLFGDVKHSGLHPLLTLLNLTVSQHLTRLTGLPVDFQLQQQSDANRRYNGIRHPLALFIRDNRPV